MASCLSVSDLKINQVNKCMKIGERIEVVSQCIEQYPEYTTFASITGTNISWNRITDYCTDTYYKNCSHVNLSKSLLVGMKGIIYTDSTGTREEKLKSKVILNPYKLFYSRSQNWGGNIVMLYIFYDELDRRVLGWINLGSRLNKYNFNIKAKRGRPLARPGQ